MVLRFAVIAWSVVFFLSLAGFVIISIVVTALGTADLRELFALLWKDRPREEPPR